MQKTSVIAYSRAVLQYLPAEIAENHRKLGVCLNLVHADSAESLPEKLELKKSPGNELSPIKCYPHFWCGDECVNW